jgi:hypothetical protein
MSDPAEFGRRVADQEAAYALDRLLLEMDISARAHAAAGVPLAKDDADFLAAKRARLQAMRDRLGSSSLSQGGK